VVRPVARMPTGRRRTLFIVLGSILLLLLLFTALSGFYIDLLWYREVQLSSVFLKVLSTKGFLGIVFGLVFFALLYVNLLIVRRLKPPFQPVSLEQEMIERYRVALEPSLRWLLPTLAAVLALFVGLGAAAQWESFLLWRNSSGVSFGTRDPQFHRDVAFYVFSLPWLHIVQGWLFSSLVGVTVIVGIAHYLWGGIRPQAPGLADKVTPQVKAHLSVLLGLIVLVKAWGYYLGRFDLLVSSRGVVTGASYTDVHAQLPALNLLMLIAVVCAVLFLVNIRFKGWALPVIGVGLLALVSIVAGAVIPAAVQRLSVAPQELQKERPYIERNIAATRSAFGLDRITSQDHDVVSNLTSREAGRSQDTLANIRLWRPNVLLDNYKSLQRIRQYYEFNDVDVDRYDLGGQLRMAMVSARQVSQLGIPSGGGTWQNEHLVYTHGFGAVSSLVNTATTEGAPVLTVRDIPPVGEPALSGPGAQPRIYYGEGSDVPFVVVDSGARELDYQGTSGDDQAQVTTRYAGEGGIPIGNLLERALFAYRFRDVNLLISGLIHGDSRIMIYRDIYERARRAVPFLQFDGDPYAAIVDGRIKWIWDAYTTSDLYPYSERVDLTEATQSAQSPSGVLPGTANYMRNAVKVVVDAYDGTLTYYVTDPSDPIIRVWKNAFPDLFTPVADAPASLVSHFRYPENLFQVQAEQFASYHVQDPDVFYGKQDRWSVPVDPTAEPAAATSAAGITSSGDRLSPYYVLMTLPGDTSPTFSLILPFTPQGRQNMVAWMAANSGPQNYGDITSFEFPSGRNVDGPQQVFARISNDPRFSEQQTLLNAGTSRVVYGDFLVIPVGDALIYVQPIYVASSAQNTSLPIELKRVVVVNGGRVGIGTTLDEALADSFVGQVPVGGGGGGGQNGGGAAQQTLQQLIQTALDHFSKANAALRAGDLAAYQDEINEAQRLLQRAHDLASRLPSTSGAGAGAVGETPSAAPPAGAATASPSAAPSATSGP
jgi:uncharacterized protein